MEKSDSSFCLFLYSHILPIPVLCGKKINQRNNGEKQDIDSLECSWFKKSLGKHFLRSVTNQVTKRAAKRVKAAVQGEEVGRWRTRLSHVTRL